MFNEEKFITSDKDLQKLFTSCKNCSKITIAGTTILSYNELPTLKLPSKDLHPKICIIINTNTSTTDVGHWFLLALNQPIRQAFIYDSLDSLNEKNPLALQAAKNFCKRNNFMYTIIHCQTQKKTSLNCGYVIAYFVHMYHNNSLNHFKKLCLMFNQIKIVKSERYIMNKVTQFFNT